MTRTCGNAVHVREVQPALEQRRHHAGGVARTHASAFEDERDVVYVSCQFSHELDYTPPVLPEPDDVPFELDPAFDPVVVPPPEELPLPEVEPAPEFASPEADEEPWLWLLLPLAPPEAPDCEPFEDPEAPPASCCDESPFAASAEDAPCTSCDPLVSEESAEGSLSPASLGAEIAFCALSATCAIVAVFVPKPCPCVVTMTKPALTATATSAEATDTAITLRCMRLSCARFSHTRCAVASPRSDASPR